MPMIGPHIKLKLLKSYISYDKLKTLDKKGMSEKYENNCNFEKYGEFSFIELFYIKYNFLTAFILYTVQFLTLSIST